MPAHANLSAEHTADDRSLDVFAERARLAGRIQELIRQIAEAELTVRALRADLAHARAATARGHWGAPR